MLEMREASICSSIEDGRIVLFKRVLDTEFPCWKTAKIDTGFSRKQSKATTKII